MLFAAIHIPDFPVEAIVRRQPEWREQAVTVLEGTPPLVRVLAVNDKAADAGVEPGMTKLQAEERLAAAGVARVSGPGTRVGDPRHTNVFMRSVASETAAHAALLDCACAFSPRVEDTAPDAVILDIAGLERIFGPPAKMARDLAARCAQVGLEANVAVAANADAALLAAHGFNGVTIIGEGREAERLGSLPAEVLSMVAGRSLLVNSAAHRPEEMIETLERWGVRTLRALAALPEVAVTERLGQAGLHWQRLARGATSRALRVIDPPLTFTEAVELEYPIDLLAPLAFVLNRLLEQLSARLAARALATNELRLRLELEGPAEERTQRRRDAEKIDDCRLTMDGEATGHAHVNRQSSSFERVLRLPVPMLDAKVFLKLLQLDLQSNPPPAPVTKVWLTAEPAQPRRTQEGLFLPSAPEAEKLEVTLARIQSSVASSQSPVAGELRVGSPELLDTHRPGAFRMRKFAPAVARVSDPSTRVGDPRHTITALRAFRPPLPAQVAVREGRPVRLEGGQVRGDIAWSAGPWRLSGDWWTDQPWLREEWDVAVGEALYRIYKEIAGWFIEGTYD